MCWSSDPFGRAQDGDYRFAPWIDDGIGVGERWTDAIGAALAAADFGLMLLSPGFFASGFIRREELPHFIERPGCGQGPGVDTPSAAASRISPAPTR